VVFGVTAGGGSITGANATTNGSGIASVGSWTLGQTAGTNTLTATVSGIAPVSFTATGAADVAATLGKVSGDNQSANLNTVLPNPLVVLVSDQFGNPVSGVTVTWAPSDGNLSATTSNTNASGQAAVNWTLGSAQANPNVTATVASLTPVVFQATTLFPSPQILISQAGVPGVGVGLTATIDVALSGPAGAGGVAVALASSQTSIFTVTPSTLNIPQGQIAGTATITGVSSGIATLTGTATGYITGSLSVDVQNRNISIPTALNVPYGQSGVSLPIQIPAPAPVGGVTFTVTSSAPTLVGVSTPTVTIPAGGQTANALLNGLLPGPSTVTVSNAAYVTATSTVTTAAALDLQQTSATLNSSFGAQVDINFTSNSQGIAAPAPGVPVSAVITNATCLKAVTTPVTIPTGVVSVPMALVYGGTASLPCTTQLKVTAANIQPDSINVTVQPVPAITLTAATVGSGLQTQVSGQLGASNHGGATVTLTSGNSNLLLSRNATTPGSALITVTVPVFQQAFNFYIQAKEGLTGTTPVTVTAQATGFTDGTVNYDLVQGAIDLIGVPATTTTLSPFSFIYTRTGVPNSQTAPTFFTAFQAVRAGAPGPLTVTFADDDLNGATTLVKTGGVTGDTLTALISPQGFNSPTDTTGGGVALKPTAAGTSTLSVSAPGFLQIPSAAGSPVTVSQPTITVNATTVGSGLQTTASVSLGASQHGGVTVLLTSPSNNLLLAPDAATAGSRTLNVVVPNNVSSFNYVVQAVEGLTGTTPVTVTATAPGFANGSGTIDLVQGAIDLIGVPATTTTLSPFSFVYTRTGVPNSQTAPTFFTAFQAVRAGAPGPLTVTFNSQTPAIGDLYKVGSPSGASQTATIPSRNFNTPTDTTTGGVALRPILAGNTVISASAPGFLRIPSAAGSAVTISQPGITVNPATVGSGLQTQGFATLGAPNHGGVSVTVRSSNPALLVSPNSSTPGSSQIAVNVPNGQTNVSYYIQGLEGQLDTVTAAITVTASGFTTGNGTVDVVLPAFDVVGLPSNTTAGAGDNAFYVRTGTASAQGTFMTAFQTVRAGASAALTASASSDAPAVGTLVTSAGVAPTRTVQIPEQVGNSPTSVATGGVAFRPVAAGTVNITVTIPGFVAVNGGVTAITVQ
jgi:hypothetical protein